MKKLEVYIVYDPTKEVSDTQPAMKMLQEVSNRDEQVTLESFDVRLITSREAQETLQKKKAAIVFSQKCNLALPDTICHITSPEDVDAFLKFDLQGKVWIVSKFYSVAVQKNNEGTYVADPLWMHFMKVVAAKCPNARCRFLENDRSNDFEEKNLSNDNDITRCVKALFLPELGALFSQSGNPPPPLVEYTLGASKVSVILEWVASIEKHNKRTLPTCIIYVDNCAELRSVKEIETQKGELEKKSITFISLDKRLLLPFYWQEQHNILKIAEYIKCCNMKRRDSDSSLFGKNDNLALKRKDKKSHSCIVS